MYKRQDHGQTARITLIIQLTLTVKALGLDYIVCFYWQLKSRHVDVTSQMNARKELIMMGDFTARTGSKETDKILLDMGKKQTMKMVPAL